LNRTGLKPPHAHPPHSALTSRTYVEPYRLLIVGSYWHSWDDPACIRTRTCRCLQTTHAYIRRLRGASSARETGGQKSLLAYVRGSTPIPPGTRRRSIVRTRTKRPVEPENRTAPYREIKKTHAVKKKYSTARRVIVQSLVVLCRRSTPMHYRPSIATHCKHKSPSSLNIP
jgi:hypothetical protein